MAHRKRHTALKALELLQNIQEDDSDAESDAESDTSVYHLDEDNCDDSESESSSGELLVLESSNSEISDFEDTETISETNKDHVQKNNATSFATSAEITWDVLDPNHNNSGRRSRHNVIIEALGPSTQAHRSIIKESVHGIYLLMKVCCVIYKVVLNKQLEEFYKQTIGMCRYMN